MNQGDRFLNRLQSISATKGLVESFYEHGRLAREHGRAVGWCVGAPPVELFTVFDSPAIHPGNWAGRAAVRGQIGVVLDAAEAEGFRKDLCSYHRAFVGMAILIAKGETNRLTEDVRAPEPDYFYCTTQCPTHAPCFEALKYYLQKPSFLLDVPVVYDEKDMERAVWHVAGQLPELVAFLEKVTGHPLDLEKLRKMQGLIKEAARIRREIQLLCVEAPRMPMALGDWQIAMGVSNIIRGKPESLEFWLRVKREVEERVANGIAALPNEEVRLLWHNITLWYRAGHFYERLAGEGILFVPGHYALQFYRYPEWVNPDFPLGTVAHEVVSRISLSEDYYLRQRVAEGARFWHADGVVFHAPSTCRQHATAAFDMVARLEDKYGVPGLVVSADHVDPTTYSPSQVEEPIKAFAEILKNKKAEARVAAR